MAYSAAVDENSNAEAVADARALRELMAAAHRPAVLVLNHPPRAAFAQEDIKPRGGSSYWAEIDANFTAINDGAGTITLHHNKMRGTHFEPVTLTLRPFTLLGYCQPDGDPIQSIVTDITTLEQAEQQEHAIRSDEDELLQIMSASPKASVRDWSAALGWTWNHQRMLRLLRALQSDGLVRLYRRRWTTTKKGSDEAEKALADGLQTTPKKAKR
jgi:hypothetical protein